MWLNNYLAALTGLVDYDGYRSASFRTAERFYFVPEFVLKMLLHWRRLEEEGASEFHGVKYGRIPLLRHGEAAGQISNWEMRQDHAEELGLKRVSGLYFEIWIRSATYDVEHFTGSALGLSGVSCAVGGHRMLGVRRCRGVDEVVRHLGWCRCSSLLL